MHDYQAMRSSLRVAPLAIQKTDIGSESESSQAADDASHASTNLYATDHITPPSTPDGSEEDLDVQQNAAHPVFHNFLRAFYPFHPNFAISDSTVTLPLNEGDVVLVHSIHTNGWADGTLLVSGARGWLPTNYCEAYDPEEMRNLLKALLNFWDLLRSTATNDGDIFGNQEFMKGIIAGVRFLLVCPKQPAHYVQFRTIVLTTNIMTGANELPYKRGVDNTAQRKLEARAQVPTLRALVARQDSEATPRDTANLPEGR